MIHFNWLVKCVMDNRGFRFFLENSVDLLDVAVPDSL